MDYTTVPLPQDPNRHLPSVHEQGIAIFVDCHPGYWLEADNGLRFQLDPSPITNDFPLYPVHGRHSAVTRFNASLAQSARSQYSQTREVHHSAEGHYCPAPQRTYNYQYQSREITNSVTVTPPTPSTASLQHDNQRQQTRTQRQHPRPLRPLLPGTERHPPLQSTNPELVAVQFADVAAHTAKCDKCDRRNKNGMTRCLSCGWQCCRPCLDAKGDDRSHRYLGTLHTPASEIPSSVVYQHRDTPTPTPTTTTGAGRSANAADHNLGSEPSDLTRTSDLSSLGVTTPSGSGSGSRDVSSPSGGGDGSGTSGELPEPMDLDYEGPEESINSEETLSWTSHSGDEGQQRAKSGRVRRNPGRRARFSSSMTTDSN
ncbi:hypothetical protein N7474_002758 [Penicillium riverlandense]|uniref:uncharacterized protein n=1 Tax=Penicillium riverlandense TaxID=1903569 RepID=UPI00254878B5|nr:uncharacterized protein N7474_002758 [Penicillium riverlandense]KAJ5825620.1 hypothetical protein N7474_002758 [Penicillium riverlandense]